MLWFFYTLLSIRRTPSGVGRGLLLYRSNVYFLCVPLFYCSALSLKNAHVNRLDRWKLCFRAASSQSII